LSDRLRWPTFWALVAVFVIIVCLFAIPAFGELLIGSLWFLSPFALFFVLGVALIVFSVRGSLSGWPKTFFILTGASAAAVLLSVLLHNLVSGLFNEFLIGGEDLIFFVMALFVCPLGFLVGVVGTIVSGARSRQAR
jgi:hypothetical protein